MEEDKKLGRGVTSAVGGAWLMDWIGKRHSLIYEVMPTHSPD